MHVTDALLVEPQEHHLSTWCSSTYYSSLVAETMVTKLQMRKDRAEKFLFASQEVSPTARGLEASDHNRAGCGDLAGTPTSLVFVAMPEEALWAQKRRREKQLSSSRSQVSRPRKNYQLLFEKEFVLRA